MAHFHHRRNDQQDRVRLMRWAAWLAAAAGFLSCIGAILVSGPGVAFGIGLALFALGSGALRFTNRAAAGLRGERIAQRTALKLPDSFSIYNNVLVPGRAGGRPRELDLVVVGPRCVFVVETKHYKGEILPPREAPQWKIRKVGRGGTVYYSTVGNPLRQVASASTTLAAYFKSQGVRSWVQGVVCFTQSFPPPALDPSANPIVIAAPETLCGLLENWRPPRGGHDPEGAVAALRSLMSHDWVNAALRARPDLR